MMDFLKSFEKPIDAPDDVFVIPSEAIEKWYEKFLGKLKYDRASRFR